MTKKKFNISEWAPEKRESAPITAPTIPVNLQDSDIEIVTQRIEAEHRDITANYRTGLTSLLLLPGSWEKKAVRTSTAFPVSIRTTTSRRPIRNTLPASREGAARSISAPSSISHSRQNICLHKASLRRCSANPASGGFGRGTSGTASHLLGPCGKRPSRLSLAPGLHIKLPHRCRHPHPRHPYCHIPLLAQLLWHI